jgi:hypothetical protein
VLFDSQKRFRLFEILNIRIGSLPSDDLAVVVAKRRGTGNGEGGVRVTFTNVTDDRSTRSKPVCGFQEEM